MKKVMFFIDSLNSGGAQRQLATLAANINRAHFKPIVVIYHDLRHFQQILDDANVPVVCIQKKSYLDLGFFFKLSHFIKTYSPDIIVSYLNTPNMWIRLVGSSAGVRHIITSERNLDLVHSKLRVIIEKLLHRRSSIIVVNARSIAKMMSDTFVISQKKIRVIYNGVEVKQYNHPDSQVIDKLRVEFGFKQHETIITLPGRISKQKNHTCLILAFINIAAKFQTAKLLFVGESHEPELQEDLEKMIADAKLSERVIFAGQRSRMSEIYALSDIVVLPSLWEGFPNVVMESMAAARPVVASDIADNSYLIKEGVTGSLFSNNDHNELSIKLDELLSTEKTQLKKMGQAGSEYVSSTFSIEKFVGQYENLFDELLQGNDRLNKV